MYLILLSTVQYLLFLVLLGSKINRGKEDLDINLNEEHWQCHWEVGISLQGDVTVAHLKVVER